MPYLIDGHNLIPKLGLRLDAPDDEMELLERLQEFARLARREVHVYFDAAPAGQAGTRKAGRITAHFVRVGTTADDAIRRHIRRLGNAARNWTVVTSDRAVQVDARAVHATVMTSGEFAKRLRELQASGEGRSADRQLSAEEVQEWLRQFDDKG